MNCRSTAKKLFFSVNYQMTIAFRGIRSLHFHYLLVRHTVSFIPPHMWIRHIQDFHFRWVSYLLHSVTVVFRATKILSTVEADIPVDYSF